MRVSATLPLAAIAAVVALVACGTDDGAGVRTIDGGGSPGGTGTAAGTQTGTATQTGSGAHTGSGPATGSGATGAPTP